VLTEDTIYANADREKILQYSLLVLLEQLGAKERAVFILKETFDVPHEEIAETLNIDIAHSRQLLKRGKEKINTKIRQKRNALEEKELLSQLTDAITTADVEATKRLLAEDVLSISDGGPNTRAARKVLAGIDRVSKFLKAIYGKYHPEGASATFGIVNHNPALIFKRANEVFRCMVFDIHEGQIQKIFIVVNPDKLVAMQPLNEGV
jgi:RNA polymerase sigma-70 factor (ECF subfamily)